MRRDHVRVRAMFGLVFVAAGVVVAPSAELGAQDLVHDLTRRGCEEALLPVTGDARGREWAALVKHRLEGAGIQVWSMPMPEGKDLAQGLAEHEHPGNWFAHQAASAQCVPDPLPRGEDRSHRTVSDDIYPLVGVAELRRLPHLTWLIDGFLPANGCSVLWGMSGIGKSFLALDLAVRPEQVVEAFGGGLSADALVSSAMVVVPEPAVKGCGAFF